MAEMKKVAVIRVIQRENAVAVSIFMISNSEDHFGAANSKERKFK